MLRQKVGLDRLLDEVDRNPALLNQRRFGLLSHQASVDQRHRLAHVALSEAGCMPTRLFGPEHGFYGVEQDMIAAAEQRDPLTGCDVVSLYQDDEDSLVPSQAAFDGLDLLVIDLQDIGARYYTFAATAVWAADVAIQSGCEVWVLDRPNPLGGEVIEGGIVEPGMESFVSAFPTPVRHGLTLAELMRLQLARSAIDTSGLRVFEVPDWEGRGLAAFDVPFVAPSPNMPTLQTALIYPGMCLVEGTELSEGRGTTRPFSLFGAPFIEPQRLLRELHNRAGSGHFAGLELIPAFFRPQFQKHAGAVCGGLELVVTDPDRLRSLSAAVELLAAVHDLWPEQFEWRTRAYEFVTDRPAIDLLAGNTQLRALIDSGDRAALLSWIEGWRSAEQQFELDRRSSLIYGRSG